MVAISPDGRSIAFIVGKPTTPDTQLWVRSLDSTTATRLDDAAGARQPFWSPDGKRIGFFSTTKLKTIAVDRRTQRGDRDAPAARGGTWSSSNIIVFGPSATGPLMQVPAAAGRRSPVTTLDTARKEFSHRFPSFLPDGRHFTYAALPGKDGQFEIFVGSLDGGAPKLDRPDGKGADLRGARLAALHPPGRAARAEVRSGGARAERRSPSRSETSRPSARLGDVVYGRALDFRSLQRIARLLLRRRRTRPRPSGSTPRAGTSAR